MSKPHSWSRKQSLALKPDRHPLPQSSGIKFVKAISTLQNYSICKQIGLWHFWKLKFMFSKVWRRFLGHITFFVAKQVKPGRRVWHRRCVSKPWVEPWWLTIVETLFCYKFLLRFLHAVIFTHIFIYWDINWDIYLLW